MRATLAFWIQSSCMSEQLLVPNSAKDNNKINGMLKWWLIKCDNGEKNQRSNSLVTFEFVVAAE